MRKVRGEDHIPIPWWAWLAAGILMAGYSKTVEVKNPDSAGIVLFFYIGLLLTVYGLGKLVMERKGPRAPKERKSSHEQRLHQQQRQWQHQQHQAQQHPAAHNIIRCPSCGAQHYATSNFCHRCGARLK